MMPSKSQIGKLRKILNKIQSGKFDDIYIDSLLLNLRDYTNGHLVCREIADFVAHNNMRNKGLIHGCIESGYLSVRYYREYRSEDRIHDITQPIPIWVKRFLLYQIDKCTDEYLRQKGVTMSCDQIRKNITSLFKEDRKNEVCHFIKKNKSRHEFMAALSVLSTFLSFRPAYSQDDIIDDIFSVLRENKIIDYSVELKLREQSDKIMLSILCLLHRTDFDLKDGSKGYCGIGYDGIGNAGKYGEEPKPETLILDGNVPAIMGSNNQEITVRFPLIKTDLKGDNWVSDSLRLSSVQIRDQTQPYNFDCDIGIDDNFLLTRI